MPVRPYSKKKLCRWCIVQKYAGWCSQGIVENSCTRVLRVCVIKCGSGGSDNLGSFLHRKSAVSTVKFDTLARHKSTGDNTEVGRRKKCLIFESFFGDRNQRTDIERI